MKRDFLKRSRRIVSIMLAAAAAMVTFVSCTGRLIARVEFSSAGQTAEMRNVTYDFSALEGRADELDVQLGTLPMLKNTSWDVDTDKLLDVFGMEGASSEKQTNPDATKYGLGAKTMILYKSGFISYRDTSLYHEICTLSDDEIISTALDITSSAGIYTEDLSASEVEIVDGTATVVFRREINGVRTVGQTGMTVKINGTGISSLNFSSSAYSDEVEFEPIGVSAALDELLTGNSSQSYGRLAGQAASAIRSVKVTDVEFVYWDSTYTQSNFNQTHIQPVYCFTGVCTDAAGTETPFTGYVRAVPDRITTDFHVEPIEE